MFGHGYTTVPMLRIALAILFLLDASLVGTSSAAEAETETNAPPGGESHDRGSLTPREVVLFQMQNLTAWRTDAAAAQRVFSKASPSNKAATGPLERFRQMVESAPYNALIDNQGWTAGQAVQRNEAAAVLVSLVDRADRLRVFRFYLSKVESPHGGEWMTDAVIEVTPRSSEVPAKQTS